MRVLLLTPGRHLYCRHKRLDMVSAHALHTASGNLGSRESVERKGVGVSIFAVFLQGVSQRSSVEVGLGVTVW